MIDFSKLKTPEEKLIVLWLSHQDSPIQAKNIFETLNLNDHECRKNLRNLCKLGFVAKYTNEWGRDVFSIPSPVVSTPSLAVSTPSPVVSTPSPVVSTPSPVVSTPSPVVSTPSPVVLTPSPVVLTPSPVSEESGELTNLVLNETKQTNKKDQFEEFEKNQPAANILPATNTSAEQQRKPKPKPEPITKLVHMPPKSPRPNIRKDMPTIELPKSCPQTGSFDGFIFAKELPRENALDRMLETLGFDTQAQKTLLSRYELFKSAEMIIFNDWLRQNKKKVVFDDVVQRFAFAVAMETPEFQNIDQLKNALKKYHTESRDKIYAWTPALQILRQIYYFQQWGWDCRLENTTVTWSYELNRGGEPRLELFPAKKYELEKESYQPPNPTTAPITAQAPIRKTPEELRDEYITRLKINPNDTISRNILQINYNLSSYEIDELIKINATTQELAMV